MTTCVSACQPVSLCRSAYRYSRCEACPVEPRVSGPSLMGCQPVPVARYMCTLVNVSLGQTA